MAAPPSGRSCVHAELPERSPPLSILGIMLLHPDPDVRYQSLKELLHDEYLPDLVDGLCRWWDPLVEEIFEAGVQFPRCLSRPDVRFTEPLPVQLLVDLVLASLVLNHTGEIGLIVATVKCKREKKDTNKNNIFLKAFLLTCESFTIYLQKNRKKVDKCTNYSYDVFLLTVIDLP